MGTGSWFRVSGWWLAIAQVVAVLLFIPTRALAETRTVIVRDPFLLPSFYPDALTVNEGDTVQWVWDAANADEHDVRAGTTPGNPPATYQDVFLSPLGVTGITFEWTFDRDFLNNYPASGNTYQYYCGPHFAMGMTGEVTVTRVDKPFTAELVNWQVVPPSSSPGSGSCSVVMNGEETQVTITCDLSVANPLSLELLSGAVGENGTQVCQINAAGGVSGATCVLTAGDADLLWNGQMYLQLSTVEVPTGVLRGQLVHPGGANIISGTVSLSDSTKVPGAVVSNGTVNAVSASNGSYVLTNVPNGVHQLTALKAGLTISPNAGTSPVLVNNSAAALRDFTATAGTGAAPDADGDCVPDAIEALDGSRADDRGSLREHITSPVYVLWNGFIGLTNILEIINKESVAVPITVRLYGANGALLHELSFSLAS
ncbi:MAG: CHRD domain-containing protein, partial [Bdellovibrionales bacterium]|nr:CHRD domain-containing protein [Bdellovibrionales bacterium]